MFQVTILFSYLQENSGEVYGNVWKVCFDEVNFYVIFGSGRRRLQWLRLQKLQFFMSQSTPPSLEEDNNIYNFIYYYLLLLLTI